MKVMKVLKANYIYIYKYTERTAAFSPVSPMSPAIHASPVSRSLSSSFWSLFLFRWILSEMNLYFFSLNLKPNIPTQCGLIHGAGNLIFSELNKKKNWLLWI